MNREQALKVIKGAFETVKKAATSDNYEDKCSILNMFDAFSDKVDEAIKVLEHDTKYYNIENSGDMTFNL